MTYLVAIDPGKTAKGKKCALAYFCHGELYSLGWQSSEEYYLPPATVNQVVIEMPTSYPDSPVPPNVLARLTAEGFAVAGFFRAPIISYTAPEWKQQIPKPIHHARLVGILTARELGVLERLYPGVLDCVNQGARDFARRGNKASYFRLPLADHLDAVALGKTHLKLFGKIKKAGKK